MAPKNKKPKVSTPSKGQNNKQALQAKRAQADVRPITQMTEARSNKHNKRGYATSKDNNSGGSKGDSAKPKEKSEVELESLVFGDNEDLLEEAFSKVGHELSSDEEIDERDEFDYNTEDVDHANEESGGLGDGSDLFFMDTGPAPPALRGEIDEDEMSQEEDEDMDANSESSEDESEESRLIGKRVDRTGRFQTVYVAYRIPHHCNRVLTAFVLELGMCV